MTTSDELNAVTSRYSRRSHSNKRYSFLRPEVYLGVQERQRAMLKMFSQHGTTDLATLRLLEVGCGTGGNLLELLRIGFEPQHLRGIELLPDRFRQARNTLPLQLELLEGDASQAAIAPESQDIVLVSTVFSSLLDDHFQQHLAATLWQWIKPGGAVLWYDFTFNNPRNADVRGVPLSRVKALFPQAKMSARRITLAPPIARRVAPVHPMLYTLFNSLPWLRTHILCWIAKS
ncbi:class I SAM-dependent methyltransferase [Acidovorax sp. 22279]|jgi:SAM-dependent methyltransferase|uniref:class I SAM-dependent methyltransferase n=1 Tax=unclassified Acidovorax TaxID=2684926 RepID=UPI0006F9BB52|nr:class I SAM-dependent methyltransferase [Acidovorax sp. Root402]KQW26011.1 methyltransferase type 11 [Acidovorax sp. Root402]